MASFPRLSFEYEVRNLNIEEIQSYSTRKNILFVSLSDLDPQQIDMFLRAGILFVELYQYHFVVHPNRPNYGIIRTCHRKGF